MTISPVLNSIDFETTLSSLTCDDQEYPFDEINQEP